MRFHCLSVLSNSSQDRSHRIRRKRAPINYGAIANNKMPPCLKCTQVCTSRKKARAINKKKEQVPLSDQSSVLKSQESRPLCTDNNRHDLVESAIPINQAVLQFQEGPVQQHSGVSSNRESDSAVNLLVSLRNMDQRTPVEESMKQNPSQQPNTPNQVILYNYILVPFVPPFTFTRLSV